jgi:uncharacterized membrane protein YesL
MLFTVCGLISVVCILKTSVLNMFFLIVQYDLKKKAYRYGQLYRSFI